MKKLGAAFAIVFITALALGQPLVAYADPEQSANAGRQIALPSGESKKAQTAEGAGVGGAVNAALHSRPADTILDCGSAAISVATLGLFGSSAECLQDILSYIIDLFTWVFSIFLWFAALLLDFSVKYLVIGMGSLIAGANGIQTAWTLVRDLANIAIIGGLIAVAIGTILRIGKYSAEQFLARLIIAALLVNFSYFFAGAVIDSSNYLATQFYADMLNRSAAWNGGFSGGQCSVKDDNCTLTSAFMSATNFSSIDESPTILGGELKTAAQGEAEQNKTTLSGESSARILSSLLAFILELVTTFIFFSAFGLLVGRFVALIFLLVTSPIGIAGLAIPGVQASAQEWWKALIGQAFFAPIYFLLLDLSFLVIGGMKGTLANLAEGEGSAAVGTVIVFIVAAGFMLASLKFAKQMSKAGEKYLGDIYKGTDKAFGWLPRGYIGGLKYGGAVVARNTVGAGAFHVSEGYRKWAAKKELALSKFGLVRAADRLIQQGFEKTADKKFFGHSSYEKERQARRDREALLGETKREEEQKKKFKDAAQKADAREDITNKELVEGLNKKDGESDREYMARQALRNHKRLVKDEKTGKERWETDEETLKRLGVASADKLLTTEKDKDGKERIRALRADELLKKYGDSLKLEVKDKDKNGKEITRFETNQEFANRLASGIGKNVGVLTDVNERGNGKFEGETEDVEGYAQRLDKIKYDGLSFRDARANAGAIFATFTHDFIKRQYKENPDSIKQYAKWAPYDKFKSIQDDTSIRRDIRDKMAEDRWGWYAAQVYGVQRDVDNHKIIEFGDEYQRRMLLPYQYMQQNMKVGSEFEDFMRSSGILKDENGTTILGKNGQPVKFEDMRAMDALQQAYSTTKFVEIADNKIFQATEQRNLSRAKRKPITNLRDEWAAIQIAKGYEDNNWIVPRMGGTTDYDAAGRGRKFVKDQMSAMQHVMNNSAASEAEREAARNRYGYLQILAQEGDAVQNEVRAAVGPNASKEQIDAFYQERKEKLKKKYAEMPETDREMKLREEGSALNQLLNREIVIEGGYEGDIRKDKPTGIGGWFKGKNAVKELNILGKKEVVSPAIIYGLDVDSFRAIYKAGHDKVEKDMFWYETLIRGDDALVANILSNENLRELVTVPEGALFDEINAERRRIGKTDLNAIISGVHPSSGGGSGGAPRGGSSGGSPGSSPGGGSSNNGGGSGGSGGGQPPPAEPINTGGADVIVDTPPPVADSEEPAQSAPDFAPPPEPVRQAAFGDGPRTVAFEDTGNTALDDLLQAGENFANTGAFSSAVQQLTPYIENVLPETIALYPERYHLDNPAVIANLTQPQLEAIFRNNAVPEATRSNIIKNLQFNLNSTVKRWLEGPNPPRLSADEKATLNNSTFSIS